MRTTILPTFIARVYTENTKLGKTQLYRRQRLLTRKTSLECGLSSAGERLPCFLADLATRITSLISFLFVPCIKVLLKNGFFSSFLLLSNAASPHGTRNTLNSSHEKRVRGQNQWVATDCPPKCSIEKCQIQADLGLFTRNFTLLLPEHSSYFRSVP